MTSYFKPLNPVGHNTGENFKPHKREMLINCHHNHNRYNPACLASLVVWSWSVVMGCSACWA